MALGQDHLTGHAGPSVFLSPGVLTHCTVPGAHPVANADSRKASCGASAEPGMQIPLQAVHSYLTLYLEHLNSAPGGQERKEYTFVL